MQRATAGTKSSFIICRNGRSVFCPESAATRNGRDKKLFYNLPKWQICFLSRKCSNAQRQGQKALLSSAEMADLFSVPKVQQRATAGTKSSFIICQNGRFVFCPEGAVKRNGRDNGSFIICPLRQSLAGDVHL